MANCFIIRGIDEGGSGELIAGTGVNLDMTTQSGKTIIAFDPTDFLKGYACDLTLESGSTSAVITHNLNTFDVIVQIYNMTDGTGVIVDVTRTSGNTVKLDFASTSTDTYRVLIWPLNMRIDNGIPVSLPLNSTDTLG